MVKPKPKAGAPGETVATYADRWFDDRERRGLSSVEHDRGRLTLHVMHILGALPIVAVSRDNLRTLVEDLDGKVLRSDLHWNTAKKVWGLVTKPFSDACKSKATSLRVRSDNPATDVRVPDQGEAKAKQWLYPNEAEALLACEKVPLRWRRLYALAIYLYLRPGELAALEWCDVDLTHNKDAGGKGRVVQNDHDNKKFEHGMPPLEDLAPTLREHLERADVTRADPSAERATTKRITFYALRATRITWEVLAKFWRRRRSLTIMQRAGHKNLSTTQRDPRHCREEAVPLAPIQLARFTHRAR